MATFTRVSDEETPVIEINVDRPLFKIDRMIYGGFTESDTPQQSYTISAPRLTLIQAYGPVHIRRYL
jgi:hypothetical protein